MKAVLTICTLIMSVVTPAMGATRTEPLLVTFETGDGAAQQLLGSLTFDDEAGSFNPSTGTTFFTPAQGALELVFPLIGGLEVMASDDFTFPASPVAEFTDDFRLVSLDVLVLTDDLLLDGQGLAFAFELGSVGALEAFGTGSLIGGTGIPVPGAGFLFAPLLGAWALIGRRRSR